jgi:hypothetical protein
MGTDATGPVALLGIARACGLTISAPALGFLPGPAIEWSGCSEPELLALAKVWSDQEA